MGATDPSQSHHTDAAYSALRASPTQTRFSLGPLTPRILQLSQVYPSMLSGFLPDIGFFQDFVYHMEA